MLDNGDDHLRNDDLIRKASEELEGVDEEEAPSLEGPAEDEASLSGAVEDKPSEIREEVVSRQREDDHSRSRDTRTPTPPVLPSTPPNLPSEP